MNLRPRSKVKTEFSMASMTDLIFLLLIFFIITSTMVSPNAVKLLLPQSDTQVPPTKPVEVAIDEKLKFYVSNKEVDQSNLPSVIEREFKSKGISYDDENASIAISADRSVPIEEVVKVMNIARDLGVRVVLRTRKE